MPVLRGGGGYEHNPAITGDSNWRKRLPDAKKQSDAESANAVSPDADTSSPQRKIARRSKDASSNSNDDLEGIAGGIQKKSPSKLPRIITGILRPSSRKSNRRRRKEGEYVPCSHYGPSRKVQYESYFFCNSCDLYDSEMSAGKTDACRMTFSMTLLTINKSSRKTYMTIRYMCIYIHTNQLDLLLFYCIAFFLFDRL